MKGVHMTGVNRKIYIFIYIWLPLVVWMAVIFHFSITSQPQMPGQAGGDISYLHLPVYFILSALFLRMFLTGKYRQHGFLLAIVNSTVYGAAMEALQFFTQVRFFDYLDMGLNFAGSCLVFIFASGALGKLVPIKSQD